MIIFRSNLVDPSKLTFQFVSSNDPDLIGVEVLLDGNVLIDVSMNERGETGLLFDQDGGGMEFDLSEFRLVLAKCESELCAWRERLRTSGENWSEK